jgi:hypothetical protein
LFYLEGGRMKNTPPLTPPSREGEKERLSEGEMMEVCEGYSGI